MAGAKLLLFLLGFAAVPVSAAQGSRPILWVLAIGVSNYSDRALTLRFAASDARALSETLKRQEDGPLYSKVETLLLVDREVSRVSILRALDEFLGRVSPVDVGVVYLAGHGVRDPARDTYYFLPAEGSAEKPHIEGLEMAELNRQLRLVHRNVRRLVVIIDTCHSGAVASASLPLGIDLATQLAPEEGMYILAAAQSGERSLESSAVGYGLFTHSLIDGLHGAAANPDGLVTVFGLASHVSRLVPRLSNEQQHPYQAIVGDDLVVAADPGRFARVTPPPLPTPAQAPEMAARERVAVVRFENLRPDAGESWMQDALREEFMTSLALVARLDVYGEPDLRVLSRGTSDPLEAAQRAGMERIVGGSYLVEGDQLTINASVKGVSPLQRIASARVSGPRAEFSNLRVRIVLDLLDQWGVKLPSSEVDRMTKAASTNVKARQLLFDAEGGAAPAAPLRPTPGSAPATGVRGALFDLLLLSSAAIAAENDVPEADLRPVLERYRATFARGDVDGVGSFYLQFSAEQRNALQLYFANTQDLEIEFSDVRIVVVGNDASVSFTRRDRFVDRQTGEEQQIVVRLSKRFSRVSQGWKIAPEE